MTVVPYAFREIEPADADFLTEMLRLTLAWHLVPAADGSPPPVLVPPRAFADLGRPGDGGVVATYAGEPAGACWYRINLTAREHAGEPVPELLIAVWPQHRAQGVGGQLLDRGDRARPRRRPRRDRPRRRARQPGPRDVPAARLRADRRRAGRARPAQDPQLAERHDHAGDAVAASATAR